VLAVRFVVVTLGVLLSLASVVFAAAAISLFVDGNGGAGGFAVFVALVCLLCGVLLFRTLPRRAAARQRRQGSQGGPGTGFYYGDSTPSYGWTAAGPVGDGRSWGGDGGADTGSGHHGSGHHGHGGGWSGSDGGSSGSDGGSSGSDGGGGY
jgi:hypothetical protein